MNIENIKLVRDHIASLPPERFDMRHFNAARECGTEACIAGWACAVLGMMPDGEFGYVRTTARVFGISREDSWALCWPDDGESPVWDASTPQAVRVLDLLMETGEVQWDRALAEGTEAATPAGQSPGTNP